MQAIPLVKMGAYMLAIETAFVALCVGVIALAAPAIVGGLDAIPSWGKYVVAVICFLLAAWQIFGFSTILADHTRLYHMYWVVNLIATLVLLCFTIAFTVTAAGKHNNAVDECMAQFEGRLAYDGMGFDEVQNALENGRHKVCDILSWADVGLMGGLVVVVGLVQLYMCAMQSLYGKRQRAAENAAVTRPNADAVPMRHSRAWDPRGATKYAPVVNQDPMPAGPHYDTYTR
ncbi:hypothetical protein MCAP1_002617 [Malassezia caprae]|uniref:Uncharacterized protein n=1 Tax=Malassezia caprae TaxID=1381934 RepID=A0AAF0EA07_9BASI|nr:hypothetical protein MCAP1_002617 [Malassezia caprae]